MEVVGSRELGFFPGTCRGGAFQGFRYASEKGAKAVRLVTHPDTLPGIDVPEEFKCYFNGGSVFVEAEKFGADGVEILAEYADDLDVESGKKRAAVVYCKAGAGAALLTGPHPEYDCVSFLL